MTLDELRQKYPDLYQGKNDAEMVYTLSQVTGASPVRVAYDMGLDPSGFAQNEGTMDDLGTSLKLGYEQTKRGLANLPNLPYALATGENLYETPEMDNEVARIQGTFSPGYQEAQREIGSAWDEGRYGDYALGLITNPGYTGNQLMQFGAPMVAGGIVGAGIRGASWLGALGNGMLARGAATAAPYIGEAIPSAAIQYKDLLDKDVDPRTAALTGLATGVGVGATAGLGGYLAGKAGYMDPEKFLAGMTRKVGDDTVPLSYKGQIGYGVLAEGAEEAVQSPWEEAMANVAQGKPWDEGLGRAAIEGGIAGGIIGGGFNALAPPLRRITPDQPTDLLQDGQQATPVPPGVNPPGDRTPHIDPLAAERQRQIDALMGGETSQTIRPGQADPGSLQGLTRDQINQRLIDAAMGGETARTFAPGQYPSDVAADLSQQQARLNAVKAAEQAKKAREQAIKVMYNGVPPVAEAEELLKTPGVPTLEGKGKTYTKGAVKYANTLAGLDAKGLDAEGEALKANTTIKAEELTWKRELIGARRAQLAKAQTLAQQAKQNATVDSPGVPTTPIIAQNAQPVEGAVPPAPTTSSVAQDEIDEDFNREMPPITPTQYDRAKANGIRSTSDLDIAHRTGELDVPTPPPSPTTPETPTNALSGQTTPQAGQETGTTAPGATAEPGVAGAPKVPQTRQKLIVDENVLGWRNAFNAAVDRVASARKLSDKAKATFSELMQRYYQVDRFSTYAGVKPPSYDAMAARLRRDGHEVSHTQASKYISDFQDGYAAAMEQEGQPVTFEKPDENTWGYALDDGNYLGKRDIGATAAGEAYVDLQDNRANDTEVDTAPDGEATLPEQAAPVNQFGEMADDATIDDELGYQTGSVGGVNEFVSGGRGGAEGVSARPRVVKYFAKRHLFATNQARAARGESPLTEAETKAELGKLSDEVLGRYLDRLRKAAVSDARLADPKDAKPKLTAAYQGLQDDLAALGEGALRATKNNRAVEELEEPDTGTATPGAAIAWQQATQNTPNAPTLGALSVDLAGTWEEAYNLAIGLPDVHRAPWLRNVARKIISEQNTKPKRGDANVTATQPRTGDAVSTGDSQNDAGRATESGDAQPELAGRGSAAPEPDIVIGNRDASNVAITTRKKRRVAPPAEPQVQQGLGEDVAATNPTTEQTLRDTIASLLGKGHNWRIHVYATPEEAHAAGHTPRKVGNAYGWVEADQKGVKHAYFIVNRIEQGTELGKFLHEVGAHIGLENILSPALYQNLVGQLRKWAALNNDSLESRLAKAALARVESAQAESTRAGREGLDQAGQDSELIAYFLEEAVKAGVDPTATKANSPLGTWFMRLWTAFKRALRKLRIENLDQLQPQHVIDLAYGAARLELNTYWHGTAASFRKFNHEYMGSGEGAQAYSWGSYLAQRFSTGDWYLKNDLDRKINGNEPGPEGSLMRVDVNATPDEIMSWDLPLNEQPQKVQDVIRQYFDQELIGSGTLSDMTGEEIYKRVVASDKWSDPEMWKYVMGHEMSTDGKGVSEWFDSVGIKGMEHFDGTSRSKYQRWKQSNKKRVTFEDGSLIQPSSPEERSAFSWLHTYSDKPLDEAIQAALDASTRGLYSWEGEEDRAFYARVAEVLKGWKEKGIRMERVPRPNLTTNLVVFNDKNIYRVARAPGGDTTPGKVRYGIAGPKAKTADKEKLEFAKSILAAGVSREIVFFQTGWYQDADGDWKWEFSDKGAKFKVDPQKLVNGDRPFLTLSELISHPELFKAYPELRDTQVEARGGMGMARGGYNPFTRIIEVDADLVRDAARHDELLSVLLHETQHGIQVAEDFSGGANFVRPLRGVSVAGVKQALKPLVRTVDGAVAALETTIDFLEAVDTDPDLWSRTAQGTAEQITQRVMQRGIPVEYAREIADILSRDPADAIMALMGATDVMKARLNEVQKIADDITNRDPASADFIDELEIDSRSWPDWARFDLYQRALGEAEARNVQTRQKWSKTKRRETPPWESSDVPEADVWSVNSVGVSESRVAPPSHVKALSNAVNQALEDAPSQTALAKLLGWMNIDQMAERFGNDVPLLKDIAKTFNSISAKNKHWMNRAENIVRMFDGLSKKQSELLGSIMGQARVGEFDPDKDTPSTPEHQDLVRQWRQLQALDSGAKVKAVNVYRAVRQHFADDLTESETYLKQLKAQAQGANDKTLDSLIKTLQSLRKRTKGPFFPLLRFGDHYVVAMSPQMKQLSDLRKAAIDGPGLSDADEKRYWAMRKDPKHYILRGADGEWAANRLARKFRSQGLLAEAKAGRNRPDALKSSIGKDMESFDAMLADLKLKPKVINQLRNAYEELLIDALPENSPLKRQLAAEGISGWDQDMRRVFAKASQTRAFALSRLLHQRQLQEQLAQLEAASHSFEPNAALARTLHNELMEHQALAYTRSEDPLWVRWATGFNYLSMLTMSPAFWFLNLMQVPTITAPWLAARNGNDWNGTIQGLAKAAGQSAKLIKWSFDREWRAELDLTNATSKEIGLTTGEEQLLLDMQDSGKLQFTITQDLGQVAEGRNDGMARVIRTLNAPTHATELINRTSTALAAYRISLKNHAGLKQNQGESVADFKARVHDAAVEFAIRATDTTQVNMDPSATARNMQVDPFFKSRNLARIMFQFWKFQQGMAYLSLSTLKDAINHPDPEIRKQARATAAGMSAMLVTTAGAFGLPFVGIGLSLASLAMGLDGDDDEDDDLERDAKNFLSDALPEPIAKFLTKGIWGLFDGPDFSPRFSMGNLMNPLAYARYDSGERGEDVLGQTLLRVFGGATGSSVAGFYDGLQAIQDGDFSKAGEKILPLKLLRDLAKTYSLSTDGVTTGKGEARLDPNDFSVMDPIWQAMGVQPMRKSRYYDQQAAIQGPKAAVETTRDKLLAKHAQARLQGKDVSSVTQEIMRFNQRNPHARIKADQLRQAVDRRRENRRMTTESGILANKQTKPYLPYGRWAE